MSNRITNADLMYVFGVLERTAKAAGVDTSDWSFGQHFGNLYSIINVDTTNGKRQRVSNHWVTKRDAWEGMLDMVAAFELIGE